MFSASLYVGAVLYTTCVYEGPTNNPYNCKEIPLTPRSTAAHLLVRETNIHLCKFEYYNDSRVCVITLVLS